MSRHLAPEPYLHTPEAEWNGNERIKLAGGLLDGLPQAVNDNVEQSLSAEAEAIAKSHGIYLEYNRAKTGKEKDWMYMVRISVPGGGAFLPHQWKVIDDISRRYTTSPEGRQSIRLTTRQNIQFHWIRKADLAAVVRDIAKSGFFALNGCGDNVRNVMGCPLSKFSTLVNVHELAHRYGTYFQLPEGPHIQIFGVDTAYDRVAAEQRVGSPGRFEYSPTLLNRKFKVAFGSAHRNAETGDVEMDNCVELRTNDLGIAPIIEDGKLAAYQLYVGGGQGEKNGKSSFSTLGEPLGVFTPDELHAGMDAVVKVHQDWGDRKNRHWARLKYVVHSQGIGWYREQVKAAGASFSDAIEDYDVGPRRLHHGWQTQESNGKAAFGLWVENGRLIDRGEDDGAKADGMGSASGRGEKLQSLVSALVEKFDAEVMVTANQDLLLTNIDPAAKADFDATVTEFGVGTRKASTLRMKSGACVGLPTCRLSYTDSEQFEPELLTKLEAMGYGDISESIGITGCERQCFRPGTKSIGWVGQGPDMYMLKVGGDEGGRHQGTPLVEDGKLFLRQVKRDDVPLVTAALFDAWKVNGQGGEDLGAYHRRIGHAGILTALRGNQATAHVTEKSAPATYEPAKNFEPQPTA